MKTVPFAKVTFLISCLALTMFGCGRGLRPAQDITQAVQANKTATGHIEWETSPDHPTNIITRWETDKVDNKEACEALLRMNDEELALFEEETKNPQHANYLHPCKDEISKRLEKYWNTKKKDVDASRSLFRFPENIQYRNTKNGYTAIKGDVGPKEVILTFDDGPHGEYTDEILKTLAKFNAKAIFFSMGNSAKQNPAVLRRVGAAGHSVGSHSMTHTCLAQTTVCARTNHLVKTPTHLISNSEAMRDIVNGHNAVFRALGWIDPFFRFPYGETSAPLKKFLADNSMGTFSWSIDSNDWKVQEPRDVVKSTMDQLNKLGRGIILMHDIQKRTVISLPLLLRSLYDQGYSVVLIRPENSVSTKKLPAGFDLP